jgi:hypothetical protein
MGVARYVTANFTLDNYLLTVATPGSGSGTVTSTSPASPVITCPGACSASFPYNTTVILTAAPSWHSHLSWAGCTPAGNDCSVLVNSNKTVTATFNVNQNVRYSGSMYGTIMSAYDDASTGGVIQAKDSSIVVFREDLLFDMPYSIILDGGNDNSWNSIGYSEIRGTLEIQNGSVTINNIKIIP